MSTVRKIYRSLGLEGYPEVAPLLLARAASLAGYRRNRHAGLPAALRERLAREFSRFLAEWGYPT